MSARLLKKTGKGLFVIQTIFRFPSLNNKAFLAESGDFKLASRLIDTLRKAKDLDDAKARLTHFYCLFNSVKTPWSDIALPSSFYWLKKYPISLIAQDFFRNEKRFYLKHIELLEKDCLSTSFFHEKMLDFYYEFATTLCYTKLFNNKVKTRLSVGYMDKNQGSIYWSVDLSRLGIKDPIKAKRFFEANILPEYQQALDSIFYNSQWSELYPQAPKIQAKLVDPDDYDKVLC